MTCKEKETIKTSGYSHRHQHQTRVFHWFRLKYPTNAHTSELKRVKLRQCLQAACSPKNTFSAIYLYEDFFDSWASAVLGHFWH